ncbi:hypothetical protein BH10PLA2_BH10PLA2_28270 [soil metagenome]
MFQQTFGAFVCADVFRRGVSTIIGDGVPLSNSMRSMACRGPDDADGDQFSISIHRRACQTKWKRRTPPIK